MIDEQDLYSLGRDGAGPALACRPVETVMRRGTRLRRRRHAVRAAGVTTVVGGLVGTGLVVLNRQDGNDPEVEVAGDPTTTTSDVPSEPPPPPAECDPREIELIDPTRLPYAEVPDDLRVLPNWTPDGAPISSAAGNRWPDPCPDTAPTPADDALVLRPAGGDADGITRVVLNGPLPRPMSENWGVSQEPTQLRGSEAILMDPSYDDDVAFGWTEPDGWSWELSGYGIDEPSLRAVAESLELDSSPEGDEPVAQLATGDVPAGFEISWQALGQPTPVEPDTTSWSVVVGVPQVVQTGVLCHLEVTPDVRNVPIDAYGGEMVTVNGQDAVWTEADPDVSPTGLGNGLSWQVTPGAIANADCTIWDDAGGRSLPRDTVVQFAESVEPVAADDPRLPDPPG